MNMKIRKAHYWNHLLHLKAGIECILTLKKFQNSALSTLIISNWEVDAMCYISSPSRGLGKVQQEKFFFFMVVVITPVPASNHHTVLK